MQRSTERTRAASHAFRFVLTMGIVNLFADMTYEGGASINGPFLGTLGASGAAISIISRVRDAGLFRSAYFSICATKP